MERIVVEFISYDNGWRLLLVCRRRDDIWNPIAQCAVFSDIIHSITCSHSIFTDDGIGCRLFRGNEIADAYFLHEISFSVCNSVSRFWLNCHKDGIVRKIDFLNSSKIFIKGVTLHRRQVHISCTVEYIDCLYRIIFLNIHVNPDCNGVHMFHRDSDGSGILSTSIIFQYSFIQKFLSIICTDPHCLNGTGKIENIIYWIYCLFAAFIIGDKCDISSRRYAASIDQSICILLQTCLFLHEIRTFGKLCGKRKNIRPFKQCRYTGKQICSQSKSVTIDSDSKCGKNRRKGIKGRKTAHAFTVVFSRSCIDIGCIDSPLIIIIYTITEIRVHGRMITGNDNGCILIPVLLLNPFNKFTDLTWWTCHDIRILITVFILTKIA